MNQEELRESIRERLASGKLPRHQSDRTWGGPGTGRACAVCGQPIPPSSSEIEDRGEDGVELVYHARCHALLSMVREQM